MKKYQRILALALAGVMSLGLAACGGETVTDDEVVTLTWCLPSNDYSNKEAVEEKINEITVPAIGAKVNIQAYDMGTYGEKMRMKMASGDDTYDVLFVGYLSPYAIAVENGVLEPLNDLIDEYAPELRKVVPEYAWVDAIQEDGEVYAVPNVQIMANQYAFGIQKKLAEKYGWTKTSIETPEELEPFLEKVKANEPDIYPYRPNYGLVMWLTGMESVQDAAIRYSDENHEVFKQSESEEYTRGVATLRNWFEKGYIRQDVASVGNDDTDFNALRYAVYNSTYKPGQEAIYPDYMYCTIGEPVIKTGAALATMNGINYKSKNKEKAIKLISLINTNKELYNLMSIGIEGVNYTLNEEGKYEAIPDTGYSVAAWAIGNQFNALINVNQTADVWEKTAELNENAISSPLRGFTFVDDNVKTEMAAVSAVSGEYNGALNNGSRALSEFEEEMNKRLAASGKDKVYEESKKQVEEFLASKAE